jgi:p-cumate 2,3-dioxygenase ferredoxin subunit
VRSRRPRFPTARMSRCIAWMIFATADMCTHGEASLSEEGILTGKIVECTFHFGTFDVTTGEPTGMPCEIPLKIYPVRVIDQHVCIEV